MLSLIATDVVDTLTLKAADVVRTVSENNENENGLRSSQSFL
jgi:hypothetical protein